MFSRQSQRIRVLSVFALLFIFTLTAFAEDSTIPKQVQDWQTLAGNLEKSGDFTGAHATYEKIIKTYPNTAYGLDASAKNVRLYIKEKQFEKLQPLVEQICTGFSDQSGVFGVCYHIVEDCMYTEAYPEAIAVCDEVQARFSSGPRLVKMVGWRGMVYARQGDTEKAEQIKQSLLLKEDIKTSYFLDAMSSIGWGYHLAGQWNEALQTYDLALVRHPDHPQSVSLQYRIIRTMLAKDDFEAADEEIATLLAAYSDRAKTPELVFRLGNEYYKKTKWQGAINVYERLLSQFSDHELVPSVRWMEIKAYKQMAKDYRRQGQTDHAVAAYKAVLERFPDDEQIPSIQDAIVETYADAGDLDNAQKALQTDIKNCPHRRELLRMITRVAVDTARAGDPNTATELVGAIFAQNPEDADQQLFGYTTRARVYVHQDKDAEAMAVLEEALKCFKDEPNALAYHLFGVGEEYYLRAKKAQQNSREETATEAFLKAISLWEKIYSLADQKYQAQIIYNTGMSFQMMKDYRKAIQYYTKIDADFPESRHRELSLFMIAECYETMERQHQISISQAKREVREIYSKLAEDYPDSSKAEIARIWLERHAAVK